MLNYLSCTCSTDKAFPVVNLHFEDSLKLSVYPHDYLFSLRVSQSLPTLMCLVQQNIPTLTEFWSIDLNNIVIDGVIVNLHELSHAQCNDFLKQEDMYCFGWQSGGMTTQDGADVILLGGKIHIILLNHVLHFMCLTWDLVSSSIDLVLSNKLVVYDLENEVIGWADHNCKSLKLKN